jgi:hypothetical protein
MYLANIIYFHDKIIKNDSIKFEKKEEYLKSMYSI